MPLPVPAPPPRPVGPAELPEAVAAQIVEVRHLLRGDAEAAGVPVPAVDAAVDRALERYRDATVHAFVGVLVEREVREELGLRRASSWASGGRAAHRAHDPVVTAADPPAVA